VRCGWRACALALIAAVATGAGVAPISRAAGAASGPALAIERDGGWRPWWRASEAPGRWSGPDTLVTGALAWRRLAGGIEWADTRLAGPAAAWRMRLIVVRVDPARARLSLELALAPPDGTPAWTVDRAPRDAVVAVNAGQFVESLPWGWVVSDGREHQSPGHGPLARAFVVDRGGGIRWLAADSLGGMRAAARMAFESYPTLLAHDGAVPRPLRTPGFGVDLTHRDARLAIGQDREGRLLIALTRFDGLGPSAGALPVGLTTPEMAAVMGALGARDAVMLDGGISAQMALRSARGGWHREWRGLRRVPLALIVRAAEH
jgi:hypothetical protein